MELSNGALTYTHATARRRRRDPDADLAPDAGPRPGNELIPPLLAGAGTSHGVPSLDGGAAILATRLRSSHLEPTKPDPPLAIVTWSLGAADLPCRRWTSAGLRSADRVVGSCFGGATDEGGGVTRMRGAVRVAGRVPAPLAAPATWSPGLTVWAVLVPESLAYATIAGVPPVVGPVRGGAGAGALRGARELPAPGGRPDVGDRGAVGRRSSAPSSPPAATRYVALTTALALVTGVVGGGRRAGPAGVPRLVHLRAGAEGVHRRAGADDRGRAAPKLFGVEGGEGDFFAKLWHLLTSLGPDRARRRWPSALLSLVVVLGLRRWLPLVPGSLVVVLLGIAAVAVLDLDQRGVAIVGPIQSGLPTLGLPAGLASDDYLALVGPAAGVLLVGFAEGLGGGEDVRRPGRLRHRRQPGAGSGSARRTSAPACAPGWSSTAACPRPPSTAGPAPAPRSVRARRSPRSRCVTLLFLTGLFEQLPEATLAAIVIAAVVELVDIAALRRLYRVWTRRLGGIYGPAARADFLAAVAAMLGVLVFDTLPGLVIGIAVSMTLLLYRASRPHVTRLGPHPRPTAGLWVDADRHPDLAPSDGIVVIRVESGLFFANADHVRDRIRAAVATGAVAVVLDGAEQPVHRRHRGRHARSNSPANSPPAASGSTSPATSARSATSSTTPTTDRASCLPRRRRRRRRRPRAHPERPDN